MALFSVGRKLCLKQIPRQMVSRPVGDCLNFHSLRQMDHKVTPKMKINTIEGITTKRNFFWIFKKRTKSQIRAVDKPPPNYELIYRCGLDHYILAVQYLGFYSMAIVCLLVTYRVGRSSDLETEEREPEVEENVQDEKKNILRSRENDAVGVIGAFMFVFVLLHFFVNRTPMRIYCYPQKQKYILYFYGMTPKKIRTLSLNAGSIRKLEGSFLNPWGHELFEIKDQGRTFILLEDYFRYPADLYIMLGLQKDPDINYDYEEPNRSKPNKFEEKK